MLDRTVAPPTESIKSTEILSPERIELNNSSLYLLSEPCNGAIKFEISFPRNYDSRFELVYLTARMLQEGTVKLSSKDIANKVAYFGAFLEIKATNDSINIELYCLKKFFKELAPLLFDIITEPTFPEKELLSLKNRYKQQLSNNLEKTSYLASIHTKKVLLGTDHPYASHTLEPNSIDTIHIDDITSYYTNCIKNISPTFFLTGDIDTKESDLVIELSNKLKNKSTTIKPANLSIESKQQSLTIKKENIVQQTVAMSQLTIPKSHVDFHKLLITNELLGGFFGSRLMKNIREDKGYTYGIYSRITHLKHASFFYISTDLAPEHSANCIKEIKKEITLLQNELVSSDELEVLRNYLLGQFSSSISSVFDHMRLFKSVNNYGLTLDYYTEYLNTLAAISSKDIQQIASTYLNPNGWTELVVG